MNVDGAAEYGGDARGGYVDRADRAPLGHRLLVVISRLDPLVARSPARCIARGEQPISIRTPGRVRHVAAILVASRPHRARV